MQDDVFKVFQKEGNKAAEKVAKLATNNKSILKQVLAGIPSENKRVKNASAKCLRTISELAPLELYPHFNFFVKLIDGEDTILKWNAIYILGNLTDVDTKGKFNTAILKKYFNLLYDKSMVTAANTFRILGKVALNKPQFRKKITNELMKVDKLPFGSECRNILAGHAILAFESYINEVKDKKDILAFAEKHLKNKRNGTRKKAEKFLRTGLCTFRMAL